MGMGKPRAISIALLALGLLSVYLASGCATGNTPGGGGASAQTTIKVSGAWALYPMMVRWGEEYSKAHHNVRVDISAGGAGKGMTDALSGMVDLAMVSRDIYPEEASKGAVSVPVVKDSVLATANAQNPSIAEMYSKGVSLEGFKGIWITGDVQTWGQLLGTGAADKISVYTRSDACGAAETWAKYLGGKQEDLLGLQVYGDPGLTEAVKKDVYGVGYNNLNYAYDANTGKPVDGITIIPIDINGNRRLDDDENFYASKDGVVKAIADGVYPSPPARDLYLVVKDSFTGPSADFVKWILTDGQKYVPEAGYIALPQAKITEALGKLP